MNESRNPILITGVHRSGTTWVGRMLAADTETAYISEPLNVLHRPGVFRARVRHWYTYICEENEAGFLEAFRELLNFRYDLPQEILALRSWKDFLRMGRDFQTFVYGDLQGQRVLLKDPFAVFSTPWFAGRLKCRVVFVVRHPAGFASSLKRLNWPFDFRDLLSQPLLMHDHLEPDRIEMEKVSRDDIISQAALLWRMIYRVVYTVCAEHPDFTLVRQEDLSRDPVAGYRQLYESLSLDFTPGVEKTILSSSSSDNPAEVSGKKAHSVKLDSLANIDSWKKRLNGEEISRIRRITEPVSHRYYTDAEW